MEHLNIKMIAERMKNGFTDNCNIPSSLPTEITAITIDLNYQPLPPNWERRQNLENDKIYFINKKTGLKIETDPNELYKFNERCKLPVEPSERSIIPNRSFIGCSNNKREVTDDAVPGFNQTPRVASIPAPVLIHPSSLVPVFVDVGDDDEEDFALEEDVKLLIVGECNKCVRLTMVSVETIACPRCNNALSFFIRDL